MIAVNLLIRMLHSNGIYDVKVISAEDWFFG